MSFKGKTVGDEIIAYSDMLNYVDVDIVNGIVRWKVDRQPRIKAGDVSGNLKSGNSGYWEIKFKGKTYKRHRIVYWYATGNLPEHPMIIDHVKGVSFGDGIDNLQQATRKQNNQKSKFRSGNSSGFRGVSFHKHTGKWVAQCSIDGKRIHLGLFDSPEDASVVYENKCVELKGNFNHTILTE